MPKVSEIMATSVACLHSDDRAHFALSWLRNLGLHAAPVVGLDDRVEGIISLGDLTGELDELPVSARLKQPVQTVSPDLDTEALAGVFADGTHHHLPVVDAEGHLQGIVSVLDLLRSQLGRPAVHPPSFALHEARAVPWSEPRGLTSQAPAAVPDTPGFVLVSDPCANGEETHVWATSTGNRRAALQALLEHPPEAMRVRGHAGPLRFRHAELPAS